jgi:hypothetical protein
MLDLFNDCRRRGMSIMESYERVGLHVGRSAAVVGITINRLRPTTDMAKMYLRAKSLKLVKRLVKKASPAEIIDVLSRPSIGVLDPAKKEEAGRAGFFLSVSADSCGAVKVGLTNLEPVKELAEGEVFDPFSTNARDVIDLERGVSYATRNAESGQIGGGAVSETPVQAALRRAREKLASRRIGTGGYQEIGSVQRTDGEVKGEVLNGEA